MERLKKVLLVLALILSTYSISFTQENFENQTDNSVSTRDLFYRDTDKGLSKFIFVESNEDHDVQTDKNPSSKKKRNKLKRARKLIHSLRISQVPWRGGGDADVSSDVHKKTLVRIKVDNLRLSENNTEFIARVFYKIKELSTNKTSLEFEKEMTIPIPKSWRDKRIVLQRRLAFNFEKFFNPKIMLGTEFLPIEAHMYMVALQDLMVPVSTILEMQL